MSCYQRYNREMIESIRIGLTQYKTASELAKILHVSKSTVALKNLTLKINVELKMVVILLNFVKRNHA